MESRIKRTSGSAGTGRRSSYDSSRRSRSDRDHTERERSERRSGRNGRNARNRKKKTSSAGRIITVLLIVLAVLAVALGALYYFFIYREEQRMQIVEATTFLEGVQVDGIELGGMTMEQAKAELAGTVEAEIAEGVCFEFMCDGAIYKADASNFTITYNTDEVLLQAMNLAREGDYSTIMAEVEDIALNGREYSIDYTVEPSNMEAFIHSFADKVTTPATPASFKVRELEMDPDTKAKNAVNIGLAEGADPQGLLDLRFEFTEGVAGYGVDIDSLMQEAAVRSENKDFGTIDVELTSIEPEVTVATLKESLTLRSTASTSYRSTRRNDNRVFNLKKAAGMVYGTVLQPGEEFSANTILGDRTDKLGWLPAPAVIGGGSGTEDQPGGGVCQISTTAYQAVLKGDLEVVYRRGHSSKSGYADGGLDCTINTGTIDFQWKNNTANPLYIFTWVNTEDYTVVCEIFGDPLPPEYDEIVLSSELIETIPPSMDEYEESSALFAPYWYVKTSAKEGYKYTAYCTYMKDGKEVKKVEANTTTYRMHPTTYCVWPGYDGSILLPQNELTPNEEGSLVLANPVPVDDSVVQ